MKRTFRIIAIMLLLALPIVSFVYYERSGITCSLPISVGVQSDIRSIQTHLMVYASLNGSYPITEQGLEALVIPPTTPPIPARWHQVLDTVPQDPWGRPYVYQCRSLADRQSIEVFSLGPDGRLSSDDIRVPH